MSHAINSDSLKVLLKEFWCTPMDAYLRAFEVSIWKNIRFRRPVLDIGCGNGKMDAYIFSNKVIDVGLDPSRKSVAIARKNKLFKDVVVASAEKIPFKNKHFASVVLNSTFEHIKSDVKVVCEISRVLKIGGNLYFTTTTDKLNDTLGELFNNRKAFEDYNKRTEHFHYRSLSEWKNILEKEGFKISKHNSYFSKCDLKIHMTLFKMFTYKFRGRELWSYLKDSRFSKYLPKTIISDIEFVIINYFSNRCNKRSGELWCYIEAVKIK